ncbi:hypothetical protein B1810_11000 [Panacagrimonas perspica]|nr:hypothetical protein B1810_11000 [Panacagrimonas perspica]
MISIHPPVLPIRRFGSLCIDASSRMSLRTRLLGTVPPVTPGANRAGGSSGRFALAVLIGLWVHASVVAAAQTDATRDVLALRVDREHAAVVTGGSVAGPTVLESAIATFYERRDAAPAWLGQADRLSALRRNLQGLRFDGLSPDSYGLALLDDAALRPPVDPTARAELDWSITEGFLKSLLHLYRGKLDPRALSSIWNVERRQIDIQQGLASAISSVEEGTLDAVYAEARPEHRIYRDLRDGLKRLVQIADHGGWPTIPGGPTIDAGHSDVRVPALRRRLALGGYDTGPADAASEIFDPALESALRSFQKEQYLDVDGRLGSRTRAALNISTQTRIEQIRANLERARWLLHDLPGDFVLVDIAGFRVRYIRNGEVIFTSRIQVGQPDRRTPIFRAEITELTINPHWIVPPTILEHDVLPALSREPDYLRNHHLRAFDGRGAEVDAGHVDWRHAGDVILRQDAGPDGALGRIAIRFPNRFAVYLHETPHTELFSSARRAFSSGCIRVEHPFDLAAILMENDQHWTREALDDAAATGTTMSIPLPRSIPILLMYWTVDVHADGRVSYKPDVYGLDRLTLGAIDARIGG